MMKEKFEKLLRIDFELEKIISQLEKNLSDEKLSVLRSTVKEMENIVEEIKFKLVEINKDSEKVSAIEKLENYEERLEKFFCYF
jgi:hypothetical protein